MGRWSRRLAERFIRWLEPEPRLAWLDIGCGTGALTEAICKLADPASVLACDPSAPFVEQARRRLPDARVAVVVAGADDLPTDSTSFDRVVSGLVLNFLPDPRRAVRDMGARTRSGGVVASYVWDYAEGMAFLRIFWDEAVALDPAARDLDEAVRFPMCRRDILESVYVDAGLREVQTEALEILTSFASFADFWQPLLGGTGPAPSYVAFLSDEKRNALRERLERRLTAGPKGVGDLIARAWAVRGTAP